MFWNNLWQRSHFYERNFPLNKQVPKPKIQRSIAEKDIPISFVHMSNVYGLEGSLVPRYFFILRFHLKHVNEKKRHLWFVPVASRNLRCINVINHLLTKGLHCICYHNCTKIMTVYSRLKCA